MQKKQFLNSYLIIYYGYFSSVDQTSVRFSKFLIHIKLKSHFTFKHMPFYQVCCILPEEICGSNIPSECVN